MLIMAMTSSVRISALTKDILVMRWGSAKYTLKLTTQFGIRNEIHPYDKQYRATYNHMRFLTLVSKYYYDTMFCKVKLIRSNTTAQVFIDGKVDSHFYPLKLKAQAGRSLVYFICDIDVARYLVTNGGK